MMAEIIRSLADAVPNVDFARYLMVIAERVSNVDLYYSNIKVGNAEDGLMSGWKTTSIFGSLTNISIFRCALQYAEAPDPTYLAVLGDDIDVSFDRAVNLDKLYDFYDKVSFPVARNKTRVTIGDMQ